MEIFLRRTDSTMTSAYGNIPPGSSLCSPFQFVIINYAMNHRCNGSPISICFCRVNCFCTICSCLVLLYNIVVLLSAKYAYSFASFRSTPPITVFGNCFSTCLLFLATMYPGLAKVDRKIGCLFLPL